MGNGASGKGEDDRRSRLFRSHADLPVYREAFRAATELFEISRGFPVEERYSLTDQMRRSSRSVCANTAEAWRKRRYEAAFRGKLSDAEAEAAETQVSIQFAVRCGYVGRDRAADLYGRYDAILAQLVGLIRNPAPWLLKQ